MSKVTESELKELKDLINSRFDEIKGQITGVQKEISDLRVSVGKVEASLQSQQPLVQKIPDLAEKVGELKNWRQNLAEKVGELKNWRQIVIITLTALISGTITWVIRGANLQP